MDGAQLASRQRALLRAHVSQGGRKWDITCNFAQSKFPVMTEKRYFSIHWKEDLSSPRGSHCSAAEKLPQPQDANVKMPPGRMQTFLQTETCWWLILVGFKTVVKGVVFPPLKKKIPNYLGCFLLSVLKSAWNLTQHNLIKITSVFMKITTWSGTPYYQQWGTLSF